MSLKGTIEAAGLSSQDLDALTHDAASRLASRANNEGLGDQIELLYQAGFSDEEIAEELGINL